jgi:S-DNA-T family DNA segregation ATPase FtsK/SpoIIIE
MRKEIIGILLFFLVVLTLVSLVSYNPADPSINHATSGGSIHNLFGVVGAHLAGILIGLFGLGAFWFPVLLLFLCIHVFGSPSPRAFGLALAGGLMLVVTTGTLLVFNQRHYELFGSPFTSGGLVGIPLQAFMVRYLNPTGALVLLCLAWLIGFILMTGFSLVGFGRRSWRALKVVGDGLQTVYL